MGRTNLRADLNERHVNMMAFSACIGFGLFMQSGIVVYIAGPGLACVAFLIACSVMWAVIGCLGEMSALFPVPGPLFEFPGRFLDEGLGYATGWNSWFGWVVTIAAQLMTVSHLWQFNFDPAYLKEVGYPQETLGWNTRNFSPTLWVFAFSLLVFVVNLLPVRIYGELEYIFGVLKMTFICGLIIFNIIVSAIQPVYHSDHLWTWDKPYGFARNGFVLYVDENGNPTETIGGDAGRFVALWTAITTCLFSLTGFELIAISAPENRDLEKYETIRLATKKLVIRLTALYTLATFAGGLNVPYTDPLLVQAALSSIHGGQNSLFTLAAVRNHIRGIPSFFTGFFIFSSTTSAINCLYNGSRLLHALASNPDAWPVWAQGFRRRLERTTALGVPLTTVCISWLFSLLAFMTVTPQSTKVLGRITTFVTISQMATYGITCAAYISFYFRIKAASNDLTLENRAAFNRDDDGYPYRTSGQLFRAVYGVAFCFLLILFNGWQSFLTPFSVNDFLASYISIVVFFVVIGLYHIKSDGWNPWEWRWSPSMQIQRPPPMSVAGRRRGKLEFPNRKEWFSSENFGALLDWIWVWLK